MVGRDDDECLIVDAQLAKAGDQPAHQQIDEADLQQVPLVQRIGIGGAHPLEEPDAIFVAALIVGRVVATLRRHELEWHVRQQRVQEV